MNMKNTDMMKNLKNLPYIKQRISVMGEELAYLKELVEELDPETDAGSTKQAIDDLAHRRMSEIRQLTRVATYLHHYIDLVDDMNCQIVLEQRYILNKPWVAISIDMGYGLDNVYKLHRKALAKLDDVMDDAA